MQLKQTYYTMDWSLEDGDFSLLHLEEKEEFSQKFRDYQEYLRTFFSEQDTYKLIKEESKRRPQSFLQLKKIYDYTEIVFNLYFYKVDDFKIQGIAKLSYEDSTKRFQSAERELQILHQVAIMAKTDRHGTINLVNNKFCEISGYNDHELIGKNHRILNSGFHPRQFFQNMYHEIYNGRSWQGEICNRKKNGQLYWVDTHIFAIFDHDDKIEGFISFRYDITKQKENELKLIVSSEKDKILRSLNELVHLNMNFEEIKIQASTLLNDFFNAPTFKQLENIPEFLKDIEDNINTHWLSFLNELDLRQTLKKNEEQIIENSNLIALGQISASMAHEINNPLTILFFKAQKLQKNLQKLNLPAQIQELIQKDLNDMTSSLRRVEHIIKGAKQLSYGHTDHKTNFELHKAIEGITQLYQELYKKEAFHIDFTHNDLKIQIHGNINQIEQIFVNLINNAKDACQDAELRKLSITLDVVENNIFVFFEDTGTGIKEECVTKIFQPFFTTKLKNIGTGIGLDLCKKIAQTHQGTLSLASSLKLKGACIVLSLPLGCESNQI